MTIIYKRKPIHECTETLIVNPMNKKGYNVGHPLDDFILHYHPSVYLDFSQVKPHIGSVQFVYSNSFEFANAVLGEEEYYLNENCITQTLTLIREHAIEINLLNEIAVDLQSFTTIPGGKNIIKLLKNIFPTDTITVYIGTE